MPSHYPTGQIWAEWPKNIRNKNKPDDHPPGVEVELIIDF